MATQTPPAWYPDPENPAQQRYWDGSKWTDQHAPAQAQVSQPPPSQGPPGSGPQFVAPSQSVAPTKLCPHCGAQSQTVATKCPNCGKGYKRRTVLKVLVGIAVLGTLGLVGCVALIGGAANEASKSLKRDQNAHAITQAQFDAIPLAMPQDRVEGQLGVPEDKQASQNSGITNNEPQNSSCIYYNKRGGSFGDRYQFCFTAGNLDSKNAY